MDSVKDREHPLISFLRIVWSILREGLVPLNPLHWLKIGLALRGCGPGFFFLGELAAIRFPHHKALEDEYGSLTFRELVKEATGLAVLLREQYEVGPGSEVALIFSNHRGFVLSLMAVTRLGADVLPLHPGLSATQWNRRRVDLILHEGEVADRLGDISSRVEWRPGLGSSGRLPRVQRAGRLVVLTSGTTGVSKGISREPKISQVLPATWGLWKGLPLSLHCPVALAIPLFHGYGLASLALSLFLGSPLQLVRRYHIGTLLSRSYGREPVLVTVPTLLWRWLQEDSGVPSLAGIITGSAPLTPALCSKILNRVGLRLYNLYGSTEAGVVCLATPSMLTDCPGCVGRPLPGNELRLSEVGEIEVRGPLVLQPGENGWRKTGDLGRFDESGSLVVCGRSDTMIVSGGENVYPHELAEVLERYPGLLDSAVRVVSDEEFGQRLIAAVVPRCLDTFATSVLKEWLKRELERHKQPREIFVLPEIPRTVLGKVDGAELARLIGDSRN